MGAINLIREYRETAKEWETQNGNIQISKSIASEALIYVEVGCISFGFVFEVVDEETSLDASVGCFFVFREDNKGSVTQKIGCAVYSIPSRELPVNNPAPLTLATYSGFSEAVARVASNY
jgi:hypothetical protein